MTAPFPLAVYEGSCFSEASPVLILFFCVLNLEVYLTVVGFFVCFFF